MTAEQQTNRDGTRHYTWQGERYVSVTTVLNVLSKPALVPWAAKITAEAAADMANVLPAMLKADRDGTLKMLKSRHRERNTKAANLGTAIHSIAESLAANDPISKPLPEEAMPYVAGFLKFWDEHKPHPIALECQVFNRKEGYAGTADLIAGLDWPTHALPVGKEVAVLDYKTGKSVWPEAALQLAAYSRAEFAVIGDEEVTLPSIDAGYVVHLKRDDYELVPVNVDEPVYQAFLSAKRLWDWREGVK